MSKLSVGSSLTLSIIDWLAFILPPGSLAARASRLLRAVRDLLGLWGARWRERQFLADLVRNDDRLLRDMGLSRAAAAREASKPFWRA